MREPIFRVYVNKVGYLAPPQFLITPRGDILLNNGDDTWSYPPQDLAYVLERRLSTTSVNGSEVIFEGDLVKLIPETFDSVEPTFGYAAIRDGKEGIVLEGDLDFIGIHDNGADRKLEKLGKNTTWGEPYDIEKIIKDFYEREGIDTDAKV